MTLSNLSCANCHKEFFMAVAAGVDHSKPTLDDVLVCAGCGHPNVVTLEGTRLMTDIEFAELNENEARDMDFVQRSLLKARQPRNGQV